MGESAFIFGIGVGWALGLILGWWRYSLRTQPRRISHGESIQWQVARIASTYRSPGHVVISVRDQKGNLVAMDTGFQMTEENAKDLARLLLDAEAQDPNLPSPGYRFMLHP